MPFNLIRDKGREGRRGYTLPKPDVEMKKLEKILPKRAEGEAKAQSKACFAARAVEPAPKICAG